MPRRQARRSRTELVGPPVRRGVKMATRKNAVRLVALIREQPLQLYTNVMTAPPAYVLPRDFKGAPPLRLRRQLLHVDRPPRRPK
jgi:hypothetical protein